MSISKMPFGNTGHVSTRTLFGAAALGSVTQEEADRTLDVLLEYGINHIDTAASYGDAELRIGPWMQQHRDKFFLATKTGWRRYDKAWDDLRNSLERMQVDQIDLWQMHGLHEADQWEVAMGPGGVLEAFIEARDQGLVRFLGITGHGWNAAAMHKRSLERFDFDAVLLPYNYVMKQHAQYAADFEALVALCQKRNVAVQTIKSIARAPWGKEGRLRNTWYEPLEQQVDIDRAVDYVLGRPELFLNTAADIHLLPRVLDAASRHQSAPPEKELREAADVLEMAPIFE